MSQTFRVRHSQRRGSSGTTGGGADNRVQMPISNESLYARPSSADGGKRNKAPKRHHSTSSKPAGIRTKLAKKFLRSKDDDFKPRTPPGFSDELDTHRSLSPESPFQRNRYYSLGSRTALKIKRIGKDKEEAFFMWKPCKRKCEWESMSGRQLTITDMTTSELSKAELEHVQRVAISRLQGMDIGVSFGLLKAGRSGKLGKLSNSMRRKISNERPVSTAVFGQPLTAVIDLEKTRGTLTSPTSAGPGGNAGFGVFTSTFQNHPDQPIASVREDEGALDSTFDATPPTADSSKLSPLSPHRDPFPCPMSTEQQIPLIVQKAIKFLDSNGIKTEGIFRVPGAKARIDEIRKQFDRGEDVDIPEDSNPHDVACLFKEFFRSLPEPLTTRDLYYPLLQTRQLQQRSQQKEALQLLCLLLPRPNRDTLHELAQFLSKVALHSNDTILLDGTEEAGNRMTSQNLATVFGPNIVHNECKRKNAQAAYQVTKADPEELTGVCNVMEDFIIWHKDIFKIPAELYDTALRDMFLTSHETVDAVLKRNCGQLNPNEDPSTPADTSGGDVLRSKSSDCLRHYNTAVTPFLRDSESDENVHTLWHQRSHSLSDTEHSLDVLMKNIEDMLCDDIRSNHRRLSSNDSAMGESECITSPFQHHIRQDSTHRDPSMYNSVDSAISNHSSHHFSSLEGVVFSTIDSAPVEPVTNGTVPKPHTCNPAHIRMSSEMSIQSESPLPSRSRSPNRVNSPKFVPRMQPFYRGSLPVLNPKETNGRSMSPFTFIRKLRKSSSTNSGKIVWNKKGRLYKNGSIDDKMPEYQLQRSPILGHKFDFETPSELTNPVPVAMETVAEDIMKVVSDETLETLTPRFNFVIQPVSEMLI